MDLAGESGLSFVHFNGMSGELYFAENMGSGGALFDFDGDGDLDVYLVQGRMLGPKEVEDAVFPPSHPQPLRDRLYRNDLEARPDGSRQLRFVDVTERSGIDSFGYGMGVASGDFDNDGWVDLYVANFGSNQLFRNNGDGTFTEVTAASGTDDRRWSVSAAFLDFDQDGWLDLFVVNYVDFRIATHKSCVSATGEFNYCGPLAYNKQPSRLFRNQGDGTFVDVSAKSGINFEYGAGLGVIAADVNGDARLDIYVANDQTANQMWINRGDGTFVNEALLAGTAFNEEGQPEASMGVVAGDLNGDGSVDLFMTHINRETNTLYLNDGHGLFRDSSRESGVGSTSYRFTGFGTALLDYDGDGWLDLFVANGAVQQLEELLQKGDPYPLHQKNQLYRNGGGGLFEEISEEVCPVLALSEVSRGVSAGDVDNDGDTDLLVTNSAGPVRLLVNQVGQSRPWLGLRLIDGGVNRDALGVRAAVFRRGGSPPLWRRAATDGSYASAHDPRMAIGLGEVTGVDRIRVFWVDGAVLEWRQPPIGKWISLWRAAQRPNP